MAAQLGTDPVEEPELPDEPFAPLEDIVSEVPGPVREAASGTVASESVVVDGPEVAVPESETESAGTEGPHATRTTSTPTIGQQRPPFLHLATTESVVFASTERFHPSSPCGPIERVQLTRGPERMAGVPSLNTVFAVPTSAAASRTA